CSLTTRPTASPRTSPTGDHSRTKPRLTCTLGFGRRREENPGSGSLGAEGRLGFARAGASGRTLPNEAAPNLHARVRSARERHLHPTAGGGGEGGGGPPRPPGLPAAGTEARPTENPARPLRGKRSRNPARVRSTPRAARRPDSSETPGSEGR